MKLTLTSVTHYDKKKDGSALIDKYGKPYFRAVVKCQEYGSEFLSGFVYNQLKEGQTIDADVKEEMYNGKPQRKFQLMKKERGGTFTEADRDTLIRLEIAVEQIKSGITELLAQKGTVTKDDMPFVYPENDLGESPL